MKKSNNPNSQLSFLAKKESPTKAPRKWKVYVDGASRNNPGPAGAGICIKLDSVVILEEGYYLGKKTNNQAEYLAMVLGVVAALELMEPGDSLALHADSQLMVRQMSGIYRIKNSDLQIFARGIKSLLGNTPHTYTHIRREFNSEADAQANYGVDSKNPVPGSIRTLLGEHGISL